MNIDTSNGKSGVLDHVPDLERLYAVLNVPIMVQDVNGHIVSLNPPMAQLLGLDPEAVIGQKCHHTLRILGFPTYSCPLIDKDNLSGSPVSCKLYVPQARAYFLVTRYPVFDSRKEPVGGLCVFNELPAESSRTGRHGEGADYLENILDSESDFLCWKDGNGRWQYVNKAAREFFQLGHDDYVGKTDFEIAAGNVLFRAFFAKCAVLDDEAWRTGNPAIANITVEFSNHRSSTFEVTRVPFFDIDGRRKGLVGIARDVTRQITSQHELHSAINQLNVILNNISSGIVLLIDRKIIWTNPACEKLLGYYPGEVQGYGLELLFPSREEYLDFEGHAYSELSRHGYSKGEIKLRTKNGEYVWCVYSAAFVNQEDPSDGVIVAFEDIQAQKDAWKREQELQEKMLHSQKLESLGVLAGGIAHDFNNLLMGIMGNVELCLMKLDPDSPLRKYVERMRSASQKAADLTAQMLAYSGRGHFVIEPVNITNVVKEMCELLDSVISKKARMVLKLDEELPSIMGDVNQMRQVVMNLIVNASEALEDKPGDIIVRTGVMEVDMAYLNKVYFDHDAVPGPYVWFEVEDTGTGMDSSTASRIFEPFFTTKFSGRGLGLAALLGIVRGHDGVIRVDSEEGRGTAVRVLFPVSNDMQKRLLEDTIRDMRGVGNRCARLDALTIDEESASLLKGRKVLVVDDEKDVRDVTRRLLESFGAKVVTAINGMEALALFRQKHDEYDVVIIDITMPDMSGIEVLKSMRAISENTPMVLASGYSEEESLSGLDGNQADGFVHKPCTASELASTLASAIKSRGTI